MIFVHIPYEYFPFSFIDHCKIILLINATYKELNLGGESSQPPKLHPMDNVHHIDEEQKISFARSKQGKF